MPRFALEVEFDGARFAGTQVQDPGVRTVQGCVEAALADLAGEATRFLPASRLDQGVSSPALPGDCRLARAWEPELLAAALNQRLPDDLVVRRAAVVDDAWSARRDALRKTYRYVLTLRTARPVLQPRCWWLRWLAHPERLGECAALLPGTRDLSGFACRRRDDSDHGDPTRRYDLAEWACDHDGDEQRWTFTIAGEGFLYQQVRGLVGAMAAVARGAASIADFAAVVAHGWDAPRLGNMAPGVGLTLARVDYAPPPPWRTTR